MLRAEQIWEISIHALREEGDHRTTAACSPRASFLSTPSARRATRLFWILLRQRRNFYPRPPRGGRQSTPRSRARQRHFYPRPPRGGRRLRTGDSKIADYFYPRPPRGGRPSDLRAVMKSCTFLSTPSARRATGKCSFGGDFWGISIHALREEGDPPAGVLDLLKPTISIHALREEGDAGHH